MFLQGHSISHSVHPPNFSLAQPASTGRRSRTAFIGKTDEFYTQVVKRRCQYIYCPEFRLRFALRMICGIASGRIFEIYEMP